MSSAATVFVVDDNLALLNSLERLLRSAGLECAAYTCPQDFLAEHNDSQPGCLVLDVKLPQQDGLDLFEAMCATHSQRSTVFISGAGNVKDGIRAMKAGAVDFLVKPFEDEAFLAAVERALAADAQDRLLRSQLSRINERIASLTARERQVLSHVVKGRLNKQIAADLGTSEKTIKVHRARAMEKMGVSSLADLVRMAMRSHLEQDEEKAQLPGLREAEHRPGA